MKQNQMDGSEKLASDNQGGIAMKNRVLLIFLAIVLVVSLVAFVACKAEEEEAPPPPPPPPVEEEEVLPPPEEEEWEWPDRILVLSMGASSSIYPATVAWTAEMQKDSGTTIRIVSVENLVERYRYMKKGLFTITGERFTDAMMRAQTEGFAHLDGGPWQQRIIWPGGVFYSGYAMRGDSNIETPYDLKGKKIAYLVWDPSKTTMLSLLAWGNVSEDEVTWVPANSIKATQSLVMSGGADITFAFANNPVWYEAEATPHGAKWMDLNSETDREGAKRYVEVRPDYIFGPCAIGVPSAMGKWMMFNQGSYLTQAETDSELIYHITKWMDENHAKYKDSHAHCPTMTLETLVKLAETDFIPLHDGTVKYLEEKGLWTTAHEARRQQNIELLTKWVEAYETAIDMAAEQGINIDPENEEWVQLWMDYSAGLGYPSFQYFLGLD